MTDFQISYGKDMMLEQPSTTPADQSPSRFRHARGRYARPRAVREQVDWEDVRRRTEGSSFARGVFVILEGLDVLPAGAPVGR